MSTGTVKPEKGESCVGTGTLWHCKLEVFVSVLFVLQSIFLCYINNLR